MTKTIAWGDDWDFSGPVLGDLTMSHDIGWPSKVAKMFGELADNQGYRLTWSVSLSQILWTHNQGEELSVDLLELRDEAIKLCL